MRKLCRRIRYMLAAMAAGAFFLSASPEAMAMDEIMPLHEVREGMTGELYTVVDGSGDIRSFGVTILGVVQNGKAMPYIIARSEGDFADTNGGLMQGMSGSPVYVDGRLLGAGSATLKDMDPHTFLITPIEEMIPLWDLPDTKNPARQRAIDLKKKSEEQEKSGEKPEGEKQDDGLIITLGQTTPKGELKPQAEKKAEDAAVESEQKDAAAKEGKDAASKEEQDAKASKAPKDSEEAGVKAEEKQKDEKPKEDKSKEDVSNEGKSKEDKRAVDSGKADKTAAETAKEDQQKADTPKGEETKDKPADSKETGNPAEDKKTALPGAEQKALVYASGFGDSGMKFMQKLLDPMGYKVSPFGGISSASYTTDYDAVLYPGSPVGAALAYGDFAFAATGTVTAVEEDGRVLAFGHPFLHRGNVNYFMTDASVFAMVNGMTDGMKLANTGSIIGRISQDRTAGIAGTVGVFPSVVPIRLSVEDKTLGRTQTYAATMAYDEAFVPVLTQTIAYAALGRTVDHMSESTVKVNFAIRTNAAEGGVFQRSNLFYAAADTGQIAFAELAQTLSVIASDTISEADLYDVKVEISSESVRRTASLISAAPEKLKAKPGETVKFKVTLQPYRSQQITLDIPFTIPKTQRDGMMHLDVHGGGLVSLEKLMMAAQEDAGIIAPEGPEGAKTVKDRLREMGETDANNDIVIEPGPGPTLSEKEQQKEIEEAIRRQAELQASGGKLTASAPPKAKLATDYVIDNVIHTAIEVSQKDD